MEPSARSNTLFIIDDAEGLLMLFQVVQEGPGRQRLFQIALTPVFIDIVKILGPAPRSRRDCKVALGLQKSKDVFGIERRQAPQLQDAPVAGHVGKLGGGHKLPAQPLHVLVVAFGLPAGAALGLHGDGRLAQPVLGNLLDGAGLPAPEEYHAVHVAEYRLTVLIVDGLTLGQLLVEQRQAHLPGADDRHQLFEAGDLPGVGGLVPQHPHMMGQAAPVYVVRPFTQEIEHLRKCQSYNKIVGGVGIADDEERK